MSNSTIKRTNNKYNRINFNKFHMDGYEETINQVIYAKGNSSPVIYLFGVLGNVEISKTQVIKEMKFVI